MTGLENRRGRQKCVLAAVVLSLLVPSFAAHGGEAIERADGSNIQYEIDSPDDGSAVPLVVLAQGSGCLPIRASEALNVVRSAFAGFARLTLEKPGVTPEDQPADGADCSPEFFQSATISQRVADYRQVIEHFQGAKWWNGQLVLFGGSEGGLVMGILAGETDADVAILLSTAPGGTFADIVKSAVPAEGHATVEAGFERARQNPDSVEVWAGHSLRFWANALDLRVSDTMLDADTNFLLIQGGRDPVPSELARAAADSFARAGRCNLTYWEFPAYDHGMTDGSGRSHLDNVSVQLVQWAQMTLKGGAC